MPSLQEIDHIFRTILMVELPVLSKRYGIPSYLNRLDRMVAKAGKLGEATPELKHEMVLLQDEAVEIIQTLVDNQEKDAINLLPGYLAINQNQRVGKSMPFEWELWYLDTFDSSASVEARGHGINEGLYELWKKTLYESIRDNGQATFTRFRLIWQYEPSRKTEISINLFPAGKNDALAKLRQWVFPPTPDELEIPVERRTSMDRNRNQNDKLLEKIVQLHFQLLKESDRWGKSYNPSLEATRVLDTIRRMENPDENFPG